MKLIIVNDCTIPWCMYILQNVYCIPKLLLYSSAGPIDYNATKPLVMAAKAVNISSKNYKPAGKLIAQTIYNTH